MSKLLDDDITKRWFQWGKFDVFFRLRKMASLPSQNGCFPDRSFALQRFLTADQRFFMCNLMRYFPHWNALTGFGKRINEEEWWKIKLNKINTSYLNVCWKCEKEIDTDR